MNDDVVRAARCWIGTPYVHQMSVPHAGCDCLGLVRGVWRSVIGDEPERPPAYSMDWSEAGREERLWSAALRHLIPAECNVHKVGGIILFRMKSSAVAKHLGIAAQGPFGPTFIHAYSGHGVVESALTPPWNRRIVARFDFPEGA